MTDDLRAMAQKLRRISILSTTEAGSGHPTTCLSCAEIIAVLFFDEMHWDPGNPAAPEADLFVLSKGHAAPILWAALHEAGAIREDPMTLRKFDSPLEGHPTPLSPWVKVATGSLGQGLSAACGMALAKDHDGRGGRVYCLLGDGECAEGSVWEAAEFASHRRLANLCAIVDVNGFGQSGPTRFRHDAGQYVRRFEAFGWNAVSIDGHNVEEVRRAFESARRHTAGPTAIVARTLKGKGVSFLEDRDGWHGKPLKKGEEVKRALEEIGDPQVRIPVPPRRRGAPSSRRVSEGGPGISEPVGYARGQQVATREAYGNALVRLGKVDRRLWVLDGDVKNSTFAEKFKLAFPDRYTEAYIAEQNMVGLALGLASEGKVPFASSFACFLTRAFDQIRMAAVSRPPHLKFCGSHAGVSIGEDGPSQMGLEDLALFRSVIGSTVLYPCDAVSTERLVEAAVQTPGIVYLRTTRPRTPVLYDTEETFPVGGSKTLRSSPRDRATVVAAGVTVFEALQAAEALGRRGIAVRVIDAYSVKPVDRETLLRAARETGWILTVEDHVPQGGLGDAVSEAVGGECRVTRVGVTSMPRSGTPKELMSCFGLSASGIEQAVLRRLS